MARTSDQIARIKEAVRRNFNDSPAHYSDFEDSHSFFRNLNQELNQKINVPLGARILDIGCGFGASSVQLIQDNAKSTVLGLDISEEMIEKAKDLYNQIPGLEFMVGDAAKLDQYFSDKFDAVIYSASIFLIPDYTDSLVQARSLLKSTGAVGVTFMDGLYGPSNENLLAHIEKERSIGVSLKRAVKLDEFEIEFANIFSGVDSWTHDFNLPMEQLKTFFSIPAMSAGLFPSLPYDERLQKLDTLFYYLEETTVLFRWRFMKGAVH